jgi:replicative DNA helicase
MKTLSLKAELKTIFSICNGPPEIQTFLLSKLKHDHFGFPAHRAIFNRLKRYADDDKEGIPPSQLLSEDLTLDDEHKVILKSDKYKPIKPDSVLNLFSAMDKYRKLRLVQSSMKTAANSLAGNKAVDVDHLVENLLDTLAQVRSDNEVHISTNRNSRPNIDRVLNEELNFVQTGWAPFDLENGGFPNSGVVVLGSNPGGGKSISAMQLAINQYKMGFSPMILSFEMEEDELWARILANICKIDFSKIYQKTLSLEEKDRVWALWNKFKNYGKKHDCRFSMICPGSDMKFSDLVYTVKHKKKDILYIDYISLLAPERESIPQNQQLQEISRLAKIAAKNMKIPVVLLAQLNDQDKIKYSGGINENSALTIIWRRDEDSYATRTIEFEVIKARNQKTMKFKMAEEFNLMRICEIDKRSQKVIAQQPQRSAKLKNIQEKDEALTR